MDLESPKEKFENFKNEIKAVNDQLRNIVSKYGISDGLDAGWINGQFNIGIVLPTLTDVF